MKSLPGSIRDQFENQGHWVLYKTNNKFSAIPIDQAHEQENTLVKGSGGFIGLTENPAAFRRRMLLAPELARLKSNLRNSTFLIPIQIILGVFKIMSRVIQHRRHFKSK